MTTTALGEHVLLAHGGGGELMQRLIRERLLRRLDSPRLAPLTDGAVLPWAGEALVFTTDSFVVTPLEFPGGDIGRLAVCGTVNDLAVMGAEPVALSLGLILEEGLAFDLLDRVLASLAAAAREAGVEIVTGDTKVIERRAAADSDLDQTAANGVPRQAVSSAGILINTSGIGRLRPGVHLDVARVASGDCVLINGPIAEHGLAVMAQRDGLELETPLRSDVAPLSGLAQAMLTCGADVKFMRDATRGGLAGVLADIRDGSRQTIEIDEAAIPVTRAARRAAEFFGLDPLTVANEGKLVAVCAAADRERLLAAMRSHALGRHAACIGTIVDAGPPLVELRTRVGGRRVVQRPYGEELPRIC